MPRFVQLPTDWERTPATGFEIAYHHTGISGAAASAVPAQAVFLSALSAALHRHTQQAIIALDVRFRDVVSGRAIRATLDTSVAADNSFAMVLAGVTAALDRVARAPAESDTTAPAANVAITFADVPLAPVAIDTAAVAAAAVSDGAALALDRGEYDLHFLVAAGADAAPLVTAYNARLFRPQTIDRLIGSFQVLAAAAMADHSAAVRRLPLLDPTGLGQLTAALDSGHAPPGAVPVHHRFEAFARTQPAAVACVFQGQALSYAELDERSTRLAHHLVSQGIGARVPVAVCLRPSNDVLVALLAIFKSGGVYMPLDPTFPEALLHTMLDEAQPRLVLTQTKLSALTRPDQLAQFCFDRDWGALQWSPAPGGPPAAPVTLDQPSHLLFTSGTTGKPKGVLGTHGNLAHYVQAARQRYSFRSDDVFCALARYTFSISLFELLSPLGCGGSVRLLERDDVIDPDRLTRTLGQVTVVHAGPSLLGGLFRHLRTSSSAPRSFPGIRHASSGGDLVAPHVIEEMKRVFPNAEIYVIYGCTEVSCMGTTFPVSRAEEVTRSFVGRAFPDVAVRVLDPHRNLVPFGVVGEICFSGAGVVPGYLSRPELTAEKFIDLDGQRFYTTGDMGRLHPDGNIEILGRRDFQVQVRGIRVELAGIENVIRELGLAIQCAVVASKLDAENVRLQAFVVAPRVGDVVELRHALAARLPDYMLPQGMTTLESLPLTPNGKLDRNRLQALAASPPPLEGPHVATTRHDGAHGPAAHSPIARSPIERQISAAFAGALGISADDIGIDDDFFDRGGDSLQAVMLIRTLENTLGLSLPPGDLFERPTVRGLAERVQGSLSTEPRPIRLNEAGDGPPLFMLLGVHLYRQLAAQLQGKYSVYGVYAGRELLMFESPHQSPTVAELARDYVDIIRRQQPTGPYRLLGMSFGGIVAYEAAQQLRASGERVVFLGLLDAALPDPPMKQVLRLASLPRRELSAFVLTRVRSKIRELVRDKRSAAAGKYGADERLGPLEDVREQSYRRSALEYLPRVRRFDGDVTLIVAGQRLGQDIRRSPTCGWTTHVPMLDVHTLDSDHLELLSPPMVDQVADILLRALRRSEERARPGNDSHRSAPPISLSRESVT